MSTLRKEPVIDSDPFDLVDRVKLTWRDVRALAEDHVAEPTIIPPASPEIDAPRDQALSVEEQKKLIALLTPSIEAAVRRTLRDTLELSLQNALSRVRADVDRSTNGIVTEALSQALKKLPADENHDRR